MSHRIPVLFAALAGAIAIGVLVDGACRSKPSAGEQADAASYARQR